MGLGVIVVIVAIVGLISLYDFFANRKWAQVTSPTRNDVVFEHRNRTYGAYDIRRNYDKWMLIIMISLVGAIGVAYGAYKIVQSMPEEEIIQPPVDDAMFAVAAPPPEEEETPPPPPEPEVPQVEQTVQFLPPVVTNKKEEAETPPITDPNIKAGTSTNEGNTKFGGEPAPQPEPEPEPVKKEEEVLRVVDEPASLPGLNSYLSQNLKYPQSAIEAEIEGRCYVSFIVDTQGEISDVKISKKVPNCPECDKEAVRVVKGMPKWNPAKNKGKTVKSYFNLPIVFKLQ